MICVAANSVESFESLRNWQVEIQNTEQDKPIYLILTKKDLIESLEEDEDTVTPK